MSYPVLKQLTRVEQLFNAGKLDKAFELINNLEKNEGLTLHNRVSIHLFRIYLLYQQGRYKEVLTLAEETYNESSELGKNYFSIDALTWMARVLIFLNRLDKANDIIKQSEELLKTLPQEVLTEYKQREACIAFVKGLLHDVKGDLTQALKHYEYSLALREELGIKHEIAQSLSSIALILVKYKGELDLAIKYADRSFALAKESTKKFYIAYSLLIQGAVYTFRGEFDHSIENFEQSLAIYKELNNKRMIAVLLNNVGEKYRMIGELDYALECLEKSLAMHQKLGNFRDIASTHDFLIQILIDKGDIERAKLLLHDLKQLNSQLNNKQINLMFLFDTALLLKTSLRARNRVKAEEIFNQLLYNKDLEFELTIRVLINLCELHLIELSMINDVDVLDEINPLIVQLLEIAENANSYWILSETYLLQAKLSLLTFDMKNAQRFLTQAQKIAESYGIKRLAMKISNEHDNLLKELHKWEILSESNASLAERIELARLDDQMTTMLKKRSLEVPKISNEDPVMLLILTEGGNLLFSKKFMEDFSFEDDILGGFLTTVNYIISEVFSEGLDRAIFGQYTLLMMPLQPFLVCYIFKGASYYAYHKIKNFLDSIQNDNLIWQSLQKFFKKSKSVQEHSIPSLESLITEIFIEKKNW